MSARAAADIRRMRTRKAKIAISLTAALILAMALIPTAASAWIGQTKNYSALPRFSFNLNVGREHTSVDEVQVTSPCVAASGYRVVTLHQAGPVVVGSQLGLHDNHTSSLSFRAEGGGGLHFTLNTDLTPSWAGELLGLKTHATLSNPGVCHEQVEVAMFIQIAQTRIR
jgi:hypothetical protein